MEHSVSPKTQIARGVKTRRVNLSRKAARCPVCQEVSKRHSEGVRTLREIGISSPTVLRVAYSKHYCQQCRRHFSIPMEHLAHPSGRFTNRVRRTAVDFILRHGFTLERAAYDMKRKYHVHVPPTTLHDWVVADMNET